MFLVHHHAGDIDEAERWASRLEASAERAHDVRGLIDAHMGRAYIATASGAIGEAISANRALLAAGESIGDPTKRSAGARYVAQLCLAQGRLDDAEAHILEAQEASLAVGQTLEIAHCCATAGLVFLCRHAYGPAAEAFEEAARVYSEGGVEHPGSPMCLGWTHLAEGDPPRALSCFRDAISLLGSEHSSLRVGTFSGPLLRVLAGVERILDDPQEFQRLCRRTIADHPDCESTIGQWHLRPGTPDGRTDHVVVPFDGPCAGGWGWCDPFQDCAYQVDGDLCIHASNGRGLRGLNVGAPRIVRPVAGDFSLRAVCRPARRDRPGIGGLLAWQDKGNYLRLDIGVLGEYGISCSGRIGAEDVEVGRGRLVAERTHLRLERVGTRVRSFCSADGEAWSTAGETEFPVDGPIEVGMHAIGNIDRLIYPGAFPHGTAIRFDEFQLWQ